MCHGQYSLSKGNGHFRSLAEQKLLNRSTLKLKLAKIDYFVRSKRVPVLINLYGGHPHDTPNLGREVSFSA
jgi:hypothetical protein